MSVFHDIPDADYNRQAFAAVSPSPEFSIGTARGLVWLAQLAYEVHKAEKLAAMCAMWGLAGHTIGNVAATSLTPGGTARGLVAEGQGFVALAIAGTDVLVAGDYITDIRAQPDRAGTHSGFRAASDTLWADAKAAAERARAGGKPLLIVGHSLGGAIAAILAHRLATEHDHAPIAVYTFGMPRPGDQAFADVYNAKLGRSTFRLVHGEDPIAAIPPHRLGFAHVGRLNSCARGGVFGAHALADAYQPDTPSLIPASPASLWRRLTGLIPTLKPTTERTDLVGRFLAHLPPSYSDHFMGSYLRALDQAR